MVLERKGLQRRERAGLAIAQAEVFGHLPHGHHRIRVQRPALDHKAGTLYDRVYTACGVGWVQQRGASAVGGRQPAAVRHLRMCQPRRRAVTPAAHPRWR